MQCLLSDHNEIKLEITESQLENPLIFGDKATHIRIAHRSKKKSLEKLNNIWNKIKENTAYQNLQNAMKTVIRGNFIAFNTYIRKEESCEVSN